MCRQGQLPREERHARELTALPLRYSTRREGREDQKSDEGRRSIYMDRDTRAVCDSGLWAQSLSLSLSLSLSVCD